MKKNIIILEEERGLVSSFMGYEYPMILDYNWVMPIVCKINSMGKEYQMEIFKTYNAVSVAKGGKMYKDFSYASSTIIDPADPIRSLFELIVKFLIWHNKQTL